MKKFYINNGAGQKKVLIEGSPVPEGWEKGKYSSDEKQRRSLTMRSLWAKPEYREFHDKLLRAAMADKRRKCKPYHQLYKILCANSESRNQLLNITYEEFVEYTKIPVCYYCNEKVIWSAYTTPGIPDRTNLDRLDSTMPYSKDNVVICCPRCNKAKNNLFSPDEFSLMMRLVQQYRNTYMTDSTSTNQLTLWPLEGTPKVEKIRRYKNAPLKASEHLCSIPAERLSWR